MKRLTAPLLLTLVFGSIAIASCATVFDKCVKPEITAATKLAPADVAKEVAAFLICDAGNVDMLAPCAVSGLADLASALGPGGDEAVNCIVAYYEQNGSALQQARAKAIGAKRGVHPEAIRCDGMKVYASAEHGTTALESRGDRTLHGPLAIYSYPGESVAAASARCDRACAPLEAVGSPGASCLCWRSDRKNWRNSRWVSLADPPPGGGPGAVGGGGAR
jgi:hypothetical protein